jgi:hypothetical protein
MIAGSDTLEFIACLPAEDNRHGMLGFVNHDVTVCTNPR